MPVLLRETGFWLWGLGTTQARACRGCLAGSGYRRLCSSRMMSSSRGTGRRRQGPLRGMTSCRWASRAEGGRSSWKGSGGDVAAGDLGEQRGLTRVWEEEPLPLSGSTQDVEEGAGAISVGQKGKPGATCSCCLPCRASLVPGRELTCSVPPQDGYGAPSLPRRPCEHSSLPLELLGLHPSGQGQVPPSLGQPPCLPQVVGGGPGLSQAGCSLSRCVMHGRGN